MLGVLSNAGAIIVGSMVGLLVKKGIPKRLNDSVMAALSLVVIYMGISGSLKGDNPLYIIICMCVGAMAVVGALQSGLSGDNSTLFAKSVLDGVSAIFFSASLGIGVILSSVAVFLYEGIIVLGAFALSGVLSDPVVTYMSAVGSLLILALGLNVLNICEIKVANLLPSMFIPIIFGIFNII